MNIVRSDKEWFDGHIVRSYDYTDEYEVYLVTYEDDFPVSSSLVGSWEEEAPAAEESVADLKLRLLNAINEAPNTAVGIKQALREVLSD